MGKVKKVSTPFTGVSASHYAEYEYDELGRTKAVKLPNNSGTTNYLYQGNTVKVTEPAGKWKLFEMDALGRLVKVTEPKPGSTTGETWLTDYTYNSLDQLTQVSQMRGAAMQTRTFGYTSGRLTSTTNPENGTTTFDYNSDGTLLRKTDAKGQKVEYVYDGLKRVVEISRFPNGAQQADVCQSVSLFYDVQAIWDLIFGNEYVWGRLTAAVTGDADSCPSMGQIAEQYIYQQSGLPTVKRLQVTKKIGSVYYTGKLDGIYTYDNEGTLIGEQTPNHLPPGLPAIQLGYELDAMKRLQKVRRYKFISGEWQADNYIVSDAAWGAGGELTSLSYLGYTQSRTYNELGQLTQINSQGSQMTKFHEQYNFSPTANNGRITSSTDYSVNSNGEQVTYLYDELNRLTQADSAGGWGLSFGYDGFGNKTSQAPLPGKTGPTFTPTVDSATNRVTGAGLLWNETQYFRGESTRTEQGYMAQAVVNRTRLLEGSAAVQGRSGRGYWWIHDVPVDGNDLSVPRIVDVRGRLISYWHHSQQLFNAGDSQFFSIVHHASAYRRRNIPQILHSIQPNGALANPLQALITLGRELGDISRSRRNTHRFAAPGGGSIWLPSDCASILSAYEQAYLVLNRYRTYNRAHFFPIGWNQSSGTSDVGDAYHLGRTGSHNFWGYRDWWNVW
jgi:YD repeat-containing protein